VTRALFFAFALILAATTAYAEPFDCTHPSLAVARIVCGDPALRAADQAESQAYDTAVLATLDRQSLGEHERQWFQAEILTANWFIGHGMTVDPSKLFQAYQKRASDLHETERRWHEARRPLAADQLGKSCLSLPSAAGNGDCQMDDSSDIAGDTSLRYQRQSYGQQADRAVIVFAGDGKEWTPIAAAFSEHARFAVPEIIASPAGKLLALAGAADGPHDEDVSALYRFASGTLEDIDDRSWLETLKSRLPDGLTLVPGILADYATMTAVATIARSQSTCCPTGGRVTVALAIEGQRVVVKDVSFAGP
jgi:uncharacterized protein